ncbi:MAG: hypothetical protein H6924_12610 [Alphaproteobacteria bacterium]|nr:hypothetical protein [Alphaproteobacteria bacterium]
MGQASRKAGAPHRWIRLGIWTLDLTLALRRQAGAKQGYGGKIMAAVLAALF